MKPAGLRPRVLVLGESANPESSSVSLEGWSLTHALRQHADVHLVTHLRNRDALQRAGWVEGRDFTPIDPGTIEKPVTRFGEAVRKVTRFGWTWTTAFSALTYYYFEELVWRRFHADLQSGQFDLVHRINPVSPPTPSIIAGRLHRIRVPFVWGPINGGVPWPKGFGSVLRREGEWLSYLRAGRKLMPGYRTTRTAAAALITGSTCVWEDFKPHRGRCVYVPENAIDSARFPPSPTKTGAGPLRVAFVGRLVPYKGVDMLLEAAAPLVRSRKVVLDIIGDGPEMPAVRRLIDSEHISQGITLTGWLDQREVLKRLVRAQVFAFPSIREFGGGVVLEAMALRLVPIVVNNGGPGELVSDETGFEGGDLTLGEHRT